MIYIACFWKCRFCVHCKIHPQPVMILEKLCADLGMHEVLIPEEIMLFQSRAKILELPAKVNLQKSGKPCQKIWYLVDGVIRMYNHAHRRELTLHLFTTNRFITDFISVKTQTPSRFSIQTVIPTTILEFEAADLFMFLDTSLHFERVGRRIFETLLFEETERLQDVLFSMLPSVTTNCGTASLNISLRYRRSTLHRISKFRPDTEPHQEE